MKILIAFPDIPYYNWQVLVQINNLVKFGYADQIIYLVGKQANKKISTQLEGILENTPVEYYVFDDTRKGAKYASSLRPHILQKFFEKYTEMSKEIFFYIDPDLIFSKKVNFSRLLDNNTWYLSDTRSYIDSNYIKSKGDKLFDIMTKLVCLDKNIIENNDKNAGGAQYLLKNVDLVFWKKVYSDSENLYNFMNKYESDNKPEHPIQKWTADMWAVLWNAWYFKHETKIVSRFSFSWATDTIKNYDKHNFFHNAGVASQKYLFNKINYQKSPFFSDFSHVSEDYCSIKYVDEIEETKNNYPDLIKLF